MGQIKVNQVRSKVGTVNVFIKLGFMKLNMHLEK